MENNELLLTICQPLCEKVNLLNTNVEFLKSLKNNKSDSLKIIKKLGSTVNLLSRDVEELQQLLEEQQALYNEMKVQEVEISHLLYKVDILHQQKNANQDSEIFMNGSVNAEQIESMPQVVQTSSCVDFSPIQLNSAPSSLSRKNLKPQSIAFDIAYLTEEEYKEIPKYMLGRLSLEAINKFIDVINDAFSKKYNILSKTMSTLKNQELSLFRKYKLQQNAELKGKHFIIEEDIARECNKPALEKKAYSFLTILRHTRRLVRDVVNGVIIYKATSDELSNV